ncbi:putative bifunctional diguanylate cyclase/phosphodiesterase [Streptomyces sp. NPDC056468]|uniref:putative bifunctional diguanylate cyclase/phosphodiesterase n=1 Tax=Streptomyces sp. NPDC056468 TaxID=3345830 RepID=UPI00368A6B48
MLGVLFSVASGRAVDPVMVSITSTVVFTLIVHQGLQLSRNGKLTRELVEKEGHFRSLVQGSSDVIMIVAPSGIIQYVSPAASGAWDYDTDELVGSELAAAIHPEDLGMVVHEVRRFLAANPAAVPDSRIEFRVKSGADTWLNTEASISRHRGGLIFNCRDVTERTRLQAQLQYDAEHDALTGLANRNLFTTHASRALDRRHGARHGIATLVIGLDDFKGLNDRLGSEAGDALLLHVADRLGQAARDGDTVARLGGDEFAVLVVQQRGSELSVGEQTILQYASRLRDVLSVPYAVAGSEVRVTASIGIAFSMPGMSATELLRHGSLALRRAKAAGKDRAEVYAPPAKEAQTHEAQRAGRVRGALGGGEFVLLHQPLVELSTGTVTAVSAQVRWRSAQGVFFTLAEQHMVAGDDEAELNRWMLKEAFTQAAARLSSGVSAPVSVQISARGLREPSLPAFLEGLLTQYGNSFGGLIIEITHSEGHNLYEGLEPQLTALRRLGVRIALGALAEGYASLSELRQLPADIFMLDRTIVGNIPQSARLSKIASGLLRIAADLGLESWADGVDLPEQIEALRELGCTHGRGLAFAGWLDEYRLRRALVSGRYPVPHHTAASAHPHSDGQDAVPAGALTGDADAAQDLLNSYASHRQDDIAVTRAATDFEHTLAWLFVHLGPPPEPTPLEYSPAGSDDGGTRQ